MSERITPRTTRYRRQPEGSKKMTIKIDGDLVEFVNSQPSKAQFINNLIRGAKK